MVCAQPDSVNFTLSVEVSLVVNILNMPYTPILATLGYLISEDAQNVLLIHRNKRDGDAHLGKYNGLGGKLEPGEDIVTGLRREFLEEAGVELEAVSLRGTINWNGFGQGGEDWFGFVFLAQGYRGELLTENPEGRLEWVDISKLLAGDYPLWDGDKHFLPLVFDADSRAFHGVMPYEGGKMLSWSYSR
jgi:8-oxo-dGTP diphosphatase